MNRFIHSPEWNIAIFAFLLNFFWEVQQMRFFLLPSDLSCQERVTNCTLATVGDVGIALLAFWTVAAIAQSRQWLRRPNVQRMGIFVLVGVVVTVVFELFATGILNLWQYADTMPIVPLLGTGALPFLQWVLVPPLVVWFARRHLV
ncbi:hypothetical protein [Leptolyngbya sp. KIOST-1]|uniref:hypothetical protein n=1 Tax=Leptolyngbya sp. KIOST-1 TaxID=1229172 RepID=UPI0005645971|nr:hypothetical protein [Leptolyngbya sp. KIOST-1]